MPTRFGDGLEREARGWAFLSQTSKLLSQTLDVAESVRTVARLAIEDFSDWCTVHLVDHDGEIRRVAVEHRAAAHRGEADDLLERGADLKPVAAIVSGGVPILVRAITRERLIANGMSADRASLIESLGVGSGIMVPLIGRERRLGCVSFIRDRSSVPFDDHDLWVATEFGSRAGLEIENAALFGEIRGAGRLKDELLGVVSHEIRGPLTTIRGNVDILARRLDDLDPSARQGILEDLDRESERLDRLTQNMLTVARGEHAAQVESEPFLVQRVLPSILEHLQQRDSTRHLIPNLQPELPAVLAVRGHIEQILENLVSNACKYGRPATAIAVHGRHKAEIGTVVLTVSNEGEPLTQLEIDRFFEPFYRSKGARARTGGAGLGMAVCSALVRMLGGQIWARPRDGGGLAVSFSLPVARAFDDPTGGEPEPGGRQF